MTRPALVRAEIAAHLVLQDKPCKTSQIAVGIDRTIKAVNTALWKMRQEGLIKYEVGPQTTAYWSLVPAYLLRRKLASKE